MIIGRCTDMGYSQLIDDLYSQNFEPPSYIYISIGTKSNKNIFWVNENVENLCLDMVENKKMVYKYVQASSLSLIWSKTVKKVFHHSSNVWPTIYFWIREEFWSKQFLITAETILKSNQFQLSRVITIRIIPPWDRDEILNKIFETSIKKALRVV